MRLRGSETFRLVLISTGGIAYAFQQTMIFPALPVLRDDLHTSTTWVAWAVTAFMLVSAVSTPIVGRLGDQHGKRRVLLIVLVVFFLGAIAAAFAPSIGVLVAARGLQGLGGSIFALTFGIIKDTVPPERVGRAIGTASSCFNVGTAMGLLTSGVIVDWLSWRYLFGFSALLVVTALALVALNVRESPTRAPARPDIAGSLLLAATLASLLLALTEANRWGWSSPRILGLFALSAIALCVWIAVERRVSQPMVDVRMLARRSVLLTNICALLGSWATFGTAFVLVPLLVATNPIYGYGFGASTFETALFMVPNAIVGIGAAALAGRLAHRFGARWPLRLGLVAGALTLGFFAVAHDHPWQVVLGMSGQGIASNMNFAAVGILIVSVVRREEASVAAGVTTVMRMTGSVIGTQLSAAILAADTIGASGVPTESAFTTAFMVGSGVALVGLALSTLFAPPWRRRRVELAEARGG
jgi:MFS family permease